MSAILVKKEREGFSAIGLLDMDGKTPFFMMPDESDQGKDSGGRPYDRSGKSEKGVVRLHGRAPPISWGPEDETRSASDVVLWDKAKVAAISAHRVIIAERKVVMGRDGESHRTDESGIDLSIFKRWSGIDKGEVGAERGGIFLFKRFLLYEIVQQGIILFKKGRSHHVEIAFSKIGEARRKVERVFGVGAKKVVPFNSEVKKGLDVFDAKAGERMIGGEFFGDAPEENLHPLPIVKFVCSVGHSL